MATEFLSPSILILKILLDNRLLSALFEVELLVQPLGFLKATNLTQFLLTGLWDPESLESSIGVQALTQG